MMEPNASEETRVAENEGALRLVQDEVIVFLRLKAAGLDAEFAGHTEMDPNPITSGEFEQHLFSPRRGAQKFVASEVANKGSRIRAAENSFPRVDLNPLDLLTKRRVPLTAVIFDFGQLGHRGK